MTYRERRLAKAARLEEWADKRDAKAAALRKQGGPYRGDWAFATQPGHIPERARMIRRDEKAYEHTNKAADMRSRAANIEAAADRAIYDDDPDAIEQLEARIQEAEDLRSRLKRINQAWRKAGKPEPDNPEAWAKVAEILGCDIGNLERRRRDFGRFRYHGQPVPSYELSNLGGRIKRDRDRLSALKDRARRLEAAEDAAGGVVVKRYPEHGYCAVTFAEKPEREILDELKAAGFHWSRRYSSWSGKTEDLPPAVLELEGGA